MQVNIPPKTAAEFLVKIPTKLYKSRALVRYLTAPGLETLEFVFARRLQCTNGIAESVGKERGGRVAYGGD